LDLSRYINWLQCISKKIASSQEILYRGIIYLIFLFYKIIILTFRFTTVIASNMLVRSFIILGEFPWERLIFEEGLALKSYQL
jgi:hypothetical protein